MIYSFAIAPRKLAQELGEDESDVYNQLKQLQRSVELGARGRSRRRERAVSDHRDIPSSLALSCGRVGSGQSMWNISPRGWSTRS